MVCYSLRVGPPEPTNPREKCNVLDVFMRCVLEVFEERVLAIIYKHCSQGVLHVLGMSRVGARDK